MGAQLIERAGARYRLLARPKENHRAHRTAAGTRHRTGGTATPRPDYSFSPR
jgi:hypothetical protein